MLTKEQKHSLLRVDHAGETGAVAIYKGQLLVLGHTDIAAQLQHMLSQEQEHLQKFQDLLVENKARPSLLEPLWQIGGMVMGVTSALLGKKAAMACTAAVEEVIVDHYQSQKDNLGEEESDLAKIIGDFQEDEAHHQQQALDYGASQMSGYRFFTGAIKAITKAAISIAKRV